MKKKIRFSIGADNKSKCVSIAEEYLIENKYSFNEYGSLAGDGLDWVGVAKKVSKDIQEKKYDYGILFCHTGTGVTIVANKFKGIRAALCNNKLVAEGARKWNDANVLGIGVMSVKDDEIKEILSTWINTNVDSSELSNIKKISEFEL